jgi:predicted nucleotidyltransferase
MASVVYSLSRRGLIKPPSYVVDTQYEVMSGSISYGVSSDTSDTDIVGFCIPSKEIVFPHLAGEILGFGTQKKRFDQFQQHHIADKESNKTWDIVVYNIVRFFHLCMECNPNMIDSLFVPQRCILHMTKIGQMVREERKLFLSKLAWHRFKGYGYSQLHKMRTKNPEGKRKETVEKFGWDTKFGYHVVRLLNEIEQILSTGDLDLEQNREQLKAIKRGERSPEFVEQYFTLKEKQLEELYHSSPLRQKPEEEKIKALLLHCLEEFYGDIDSCIKQMSSTEQIINDFVEIIKKHDAGTVWHWISIR